MFCDLLSAHYWTSWVDEDEWWSWRWLEREKPEGTSSYDSVLHSIKEYIYTLLGGYICSLIVFCINIVMYLSSQFTRVYSGITTYVWTTRFVMGITPLSMCWETPMATVWQTCINKYIQSTSGVTYWLPLVLVNKNMWSLYVGRILWVFNQWPIFVQLYNTVDHVSI